MQALSCSIAIIGLFLLAIRAQENKNANLTAPAIPAPAAVSFAETGQQLNRLAGRGVALADLNGDGCLDAFVVNVNTQDGEGNRVYFGNCHGQFTDGGQRLANPSNWKGGKPAIGDVNGDGKPDVITGNMVWINDGRGYFTAHPELIETPGSGEWGPAGCAYIVFDVCARRTRATRVSPRLMHGLCWLLNGPARRDVGATRESLQHIR